MMEKVSRKIILMLFNEAVIEENNIDAYSYTLQIVLEQLIVYTILIVIAVATNRVIETVLFILYFSGLRKYSGGFHMSSFGGCLITSIIVFVGYSLFIYPVLLNHKSLNDIILFLSVLLVFVIGAVNNENIHWTDEEIKDAKKISRIVVILEYASILVFKCFKITEGISLYMGFGITLCAIAIFLSLAQKKIYNNLARADKTDG